MFRERHRSFLTVLFSFPPDRLQQLAVFLTERSSLQQIRTVGQGFAQLLLTAPAANPGVVAIEQGLGDAQAAKLRGPGVVRVVQQAPGAVLRTRNAIPGVRS